jgi:hypothetical protein
MTDLRIKEEDICPEECGNLTSTDYIRGDEIAAYWFEFSYRPAYRRTNGNKNRCRYTTTGLLVLTPPGVQAFVAVTFTVKVLTVLKVWKTFGVPFGNTVPSPKSQSKTMGMDASIGK